MNSLLLPRTDENGISYLSYSQYTTWLRNKRDYIRQYFFKESFTGNAYTDFGSEVGEALENNDFTGFTSKEIKFLKTIPRYSEFEREIKLQMNGFYVKGFIDTNSACLTKLADYKTGDIVKKSPEYQSDKYNQLGIYAAAIEQETGVLPTDVKVYLIGRSGNAFKNEKLRLTGEFVEIKKEVTRERIDIVKEQLQQVAEEISRHYTAFLKLNIITP